MANFTYPKGTETRVVKVTLSEADYQAALQLGAGYAAHGLREAIRLVESPAGSLAALLYKKESSKC